MSKLVASPKKSKNKTYKCPDERVYLIIRDPYPYHLSLGKAEQREGCWTACVQWLLILINDLASIPLDPRDILLHWNSKDNNVLVEIELQVLHQHLKQNFDGILGSHLPKLFLKSPDQDLGEYHGHTITSIFLYDYTKFGDPENNNWWKGGFDSRVYVKATSPDFPVKSGGSYPTPQPTNDAPPSMAKRLSRQPDEAANPDPEHTAGTDTAPGPSTSVPTTSQKRRRDSPDTTHDERRPPLRFSQTAAKMVVVLREEVVLVAMEEVVLVAMKEVILVPRENMDVVKDQHEAARGRGGQAGSFAGWDGPTEARSATHGALPVVDLKLHADEDDGSETGVQRSAGDACNHGQPHATLLVLKTLAILPMPSYRKRPTATVKLKAVSCRAFLYSTPVSPVTIPVKREMTSLPQRRGHSFIGPRANIERLEYLVVRPVFTRDVVGTIHDCIVTVGEQRFLVCSHYDDCVPVNPALKRLFKGYNWRGELVVAALGRRKSLGFVEVTRFNGSEIKKVLNRFMATAE
ncbi:hypothetical protein FB45DRAFT_1017911 [Roridomyces roridus]|uniref:Uncharacterized protein n=1 Tax=Roridomyces roridus TaxID=1738132 RepID=A0AAD7G2L2_9AGAR|nr:hypothetical protein FB45DRAFT_1017911 [Roridomyces roridus]